MSIMHNPNLQTSYPNRLTVSLGILLEQQAEKHADNPFITQAETGESWSYDAFNKRTNRIARGLMSHHLHDNPYFGVMLANSLDFLATSYALKKLGVIEVAINATFRGVSLARMINLTGLNCLMTSSDYLPFLREILDDLPQLQHLILIDGTEAAKDLADRIRIHSLDEILSDRDENCAMPVRDDDIAQILFTSGTTGVSKGCLMPHRSAVRAAESMIMAFNLTEKDCVYSPYPLFHVGAAHYDILPALMVGAQAVIRDKFSLRHFWQDQVRYQTSWFMCLGSVQQLLWSAPACPEEKQHQMRFIWGTPLPIDHEAFQERFGVKLARGGGYGSTDAGSVALPLFDKVGAGKVLDNYEVAIVDEFDNPLPADIVGELVIRPREPAIMSAGYFAMPDKTVEAWRNLWFHTGDLARLDQEGDLYWVARMSERIRVKGEMVSAYEIEEVLLTHPSVEDCAVLGAPDTYGEEQVHAFVTLRKDSDMMPQDLINFCNGRMSRFMIPEMVTLLTEMPRTPSGKPAKAELAKLFNE